MMYRQFLRPFLVVFCLAGFASANTYITTIPVGRHPTHLAVNKSTGFIYVDNVLDNTVTVINSQNMTVTVPLASQPAGIAVNQGINRFYVSIQGAVAVYDGTDNSLVTTIPVSGTPSVIAINPNTNRLYVQDSADNEVHVIDGASNQVIAELPVSHPGNGIDFNEASNLIYVSSASASGRSISVFDGISNLLTNTLTLPGNPSFTYLTYHAQDNELYTITQPSGGGAYSFSLLDASSGELLNTIPLKGKPMAVLAIPVSTLEAITDDGISKVDFMFPFGSGISCTVQVGRGPAGMATFAPTGYNLAVANRLDNTVDIVSGPGCP
jgi:YVTN family beta-propeller protein